MLEINTLRRLKMLFQRPYSSKSSGEACPWTPIAARAFGARDCPPPPNKSNLTTALREKVVPSFLSYLKTLSIGPAAGIEPTTSRNVVNRSVPTDLVAV